MVTWRKMWLGRFSYNCRNNYGLIIQIFVNNVNYYRIGIQLSISSDKAEKLDKSKQAIASRDLYKKCEADLILTIESKIIVK